MISHESTSIKWKKLPKVVVGMVLVLAGYYFTISGKFPKLICTACYKLTFFPLSTISPLVPVLIFYRVLYIQSKNF
jgi:hypothetical protein